MEVCADRYQKRSPQGYDETSILVDQDEESLTLPFAIDSRDVPIVSLCEAPI
jgi:hypothetical protein